MPYIVMTASEQMPQSCWGRYGKVAVVEVEADFVGIPAMISERARGVRRIVDEWRRLNVGRTDRSAYWRAVREAEAMASRLNEKEGREDKKALASE